MTSLDKHMVKPLNVGDVSRDFGLFRIDCDNCPHRGVIDAWTAYKLFGPRTLIANIKARCTKCGSRKTKARPYEALLFIPAERAVTPPM
jgi:hypothetical protein